MCGGSILAPESVTALARLGMGSSTRRRALLFGLSVLCGRLSVVPAARAADGDSRASVLAAMARVEKPFVTRLRNGLSLVVQPLPEQTRVAVVVSYRAGSRDDPAGKSGLAHLVGHLMFRGSRHLKLSHVKPQPRSAF